MVPTQSLDALWLAYEQFEMQGQQALGRRALDEMRPRVNGARSAYRLRSRALERIHPAALPLPPGAPPRSPQPGCACEGARQC